MVFSFICSNTMVTFCKGFKPSNAYLDPKTLKIRVWKSNLNLDINRKLLDFDKFKSNTCETSMIHLRSAPQYIYITSQISKYVILNMFIDRSHRQVSIDILG